MERKGYRILTRNFRCRYGEIDIIAEHEDELVFVEVKTRRGDAYGLPEEAVGWRKQQKLVQVASYYLDVQQRAESAWRIDVVAVQMSVQGKLEEIRIYQHVLVEDQQ